MHLFGLEVLSAIRERVGEASAEARAQERTRPARGGVIRHELRDSGESTEVNAYSTPVLTSRKHRTCDGPHSVGTLHHERHWQRRVRAVINKFVPTLLERPIQSQLSWRVSLIAQHELLNLAGLRLG